jgi:CheY-like chemotaxis protein
MIAAQAWSGLRLLVVEDEYFLAEDLVDHFQSLGVAVLGPAGTVADALQILASNDAQAAVLDVNLRGERVYPVAKLLQQRNVPFIFASGYGGELEPAAFADVPRCIKPVEFAALAKALADEIAKNRILCHKQRGGVDDPEE